MAQLLWVLLFALTIVCFTIPSRYTLYKLGGIAGFAGTVALPLWLLRSAKWSRRIFAALCAVAAFVACFLILPKRPYDSRDLRREYVRSLLSYTGAKYVWGGGNRLGIDCSGLVEQALVDALVRRGAATLNSGLARDGLSLWWHNRSARALGEGYRGDTRLVSEIASLNAADYRSIAPGDLAVLSDGIHVLAYIGDQTWIEADPVPGKVVIALAPQDGDFYFNSPVKIMRWRVLD